MKFNFVNTVVVAALAAGCFLAPVAVHAQATGQAAAENEAAASQREGVVESDEAAASSAAGTAAGGGSGSGIQAADQAGVDASLAEKWRDSEVDVNGGVAGSAPGMSEEARAEAVLVNVKSAFEMEFPGIVLDSVKPTRFAGIYELRIGSDLLYTDEQVRFVMQGSLIDAHNKEDLTAKSLEELTRVSFDSLPLQSAIKQVKGDGSRKMVVFEDPNCGYCKRLHQTLERMDNYTVYTLLYPILSPDSTAKARNIWCAADRVEAWRAQMLRNEAPPNAQCETPIEANLALGRKLLVRGTPAIIFEDGSRVNGALPLEGLEARLDAATAAVAAASGAAVSRR